VAGLLLATMPTNVLFMKRDIEMATRASHDLNELPAFWSKADREAMEWARRHLPGDGVIFCSTVSGRLFPALAGRQVYVGHWSETPHANARMRETIAFYRAARATSAQRRAFLEARGIRYVYQGTPERRIGAVDLARDSLFRPLYRNDGAAIYELRPLTSAQSSPQVKRS
jgi:uncharacterized membrane protein